MGIPEQQLKHLIPSERTLANACIDMQCLSELMVGDLVALSEHRSFGFDASTKFGTKLQHTCMYIPGKAGGPAVRALHTGAEMLLGETADLGAEAVEKRFEVVQRMGKAAGSDYEHVANLTLLNMAGKAGGGRG